MYSNILGLQNVFKVTERFRLIFFGFRTTIVDFLRAARDEKKSIILKRSKSSAALGTRVLKF